MLCLMGALALVEEECDGCHDFTLRGLGDDLVDYISIKATLGCHKESMSQHVVRINDVRGRGF